MKFVYDKLLILGVAIVVIGVGGVAFWLADVYSISPGWVFAGWCSAIFIVSIGHSLREHFTSRLFLLYFSAWVFVNATISLLLIAFVPLRYWYFVYCAELALGYLLAVRLFRPGGRNP